MLYNTIQCRYAPSLGGGFEGHPNKVWGTIPYKSRKLPTVFCGMYDLRDYLALWLHRGKKWCFWCGSDIRTFRSNFIFNEGKLLWLSQLFASFNINFRDWLVRNVMSKVEHWVENEAEAWQLTDCGLKVSGIRQSFFGDIKKFKVSFKPGNKVYLSASGGLTDNYGWGTIFQIAWACPEIEFHLYGARMKELDKLLNAQGITMKQFYPNVIIHGRVSMKQMNKEIKNMQCGLRLNKHDGFSEITAKSILWGQYPITYLYFPMIDQFKADDYGIPDTSGNIQKLVRLLKAIPKKKKPNIIARSYYLAKLNKFPWSP